MNILNIGTEVNKYKKAICKSCNNKLVQGEMIVWVMRTQGRFLSTSNYHFDCVGTELKEVQAELDIMYTNLISVSAEIDYAKANKV
jgi:hypothetical protein